ncbi:MAG: hypothetical protein EA368_04495 [Leptolyngbya sp. DLM2.Bin27]|nr:MAG: hypothetical protein EA368_04495 [Leptolyngbya sp. DLM2.Bin27]
MKSTYRAQVYPRFYVSNGSVYTLQALSESVKSLYRSVAGRLGAASEPYAWATHREGQTRWHAIDPITGQTVCGVSEPALRQWLDHLYTQR